MPALLEAFEAYFIVRLGYSTKEYPFSAYYLADIFLNVLASMDQSLQDELKPVAGAIQVIKESHLSSPSIEEQGAFKLAGSPDREYKLIKSSLESHCSYILVEYDANSQDRKSVV